MPKEIRLESGHVIGHGHPCFFIAEIGNNHQGDIANARRMVEAAASMGVQAVKLQKRHTPSLFTREGMDAPYTGKNSFGPTYGEHRDALELSIGEVAELKDMAESLGLVCFASAWDDHSSGQMIDLGVELIKVCSADLVNLPALDRIGRTGIPVVLSTGMSTLEDIDLAVQTLRAHHSNIILLHCNSSYPCPERDIALPVMTMLRERFGLPTGYSGHERGIAPSVAAAALGACVIERHFTLDRTQRGTDHQVSLEPDEFGRLVHMVREVEAAMSVTAKRVCETERQQARKLRKSLVFRTDLPAGHILTEDDLAAKCPGTGVPPTRRDDALGCRLMRAVAADEPFDWEAVESCRHTA